MKTPEDEQQEAEAVERITGTLDEYEVSEPDDEEAK